MSCRPDGVIQSDTWPSIHSQPGRLLIKTRTDKSFSSKFESFKSLISKWLSKRAAPNTELLTSIDSYASFSHSDHLPTGDPIDRAHQSPGSSSHTPLPIANGPNVLPLGQCTVRTDRSKSLALALSIECFLPPPSPVDATASGQSRTRTVLQGTISALKLIQQIVGLAPVPGLQSLVGVVLNISEVVNASFLCHPHLACKILTLFQSIEYVCRRRCSR